MAAHEDGYATERFDSPVSRRFQCGICFNVFKNPVMCRRNQHIFCRGCITTHLANYQKCPVCNDQLTLDTLTDPPRILTECLGELRIRCDFYARGCRQYIELDDLERHVNDCGFAPAVCSNEGCQLEVNSSELVYHETAVCEHRRVKCHNCEHITREIDDAHDRLDHIERKINQTCESVSGLVDKVTQLVSRQAATTVVMNTKLSSIDTKLKRLEESELRIQEHNRDIKASLTGMMEPLSKIARIETELKTSMKSNETTTNDKSVEMLNVIVAGGCSYGKKLGSFEKYNMSSGTWTLESGIGRYICRASAVVHHNLMLITGGENSNSSGYNVTAAVTDEIVRMNMDIPAIPNPSLSRLGGTDVKFTRFPAKLPRKLSGHCTVVYNDYLYVLGGRDDQGVISADIHKIQLVSPYTCKLVAKMPVGRWNHSVQLFDDRIICVGGEVPSGYGDSAGNSSSSTSSGTSLGRASGSITTGSTSSGNGGRDVCNTSSVLEYDITNNVCKQLVPLSYAVSEAASVRFGDNMIVIGGVTSSGDPLRWCSMYNVKTQLRDSFPGLNKGRRGCVAAVLGNYIMVMGGEELEHGKKGKVWRRVLASVERFCFERYSWTEVRSMNEFRYLATAVVY